MNIEYTKTTEKTFDEVLEAVQSAAARRNFRTLHVHDVTRTLAEKGFEIESYSIVEVCNAGFAYRLLKEWKRAGMMLPCRIAVYADGGKTAVTLMKPTLISDLLPGRDFGDVPARVEEVLAEVVDEAAS